MDDATNLKSIPAELHPELDLYTIPSSSSWFSWNGIHLNERIALKEFFDGSSFTRSPKYYKEYRDFIINKYREDPSRRLTFTEVRKSLVGDVSLLHKVFRFLEKWGLINFNVGVDDGKKKEEDEQEEEGIKCKVKVEDGAPMGVRVVGMPNSMRHVAALPHCGVRSSSSNSRVVENGFSHLPLASYSDVYGDLIKEKVLNCGSCSQECGESGHYRSTKQESSVICTKCFENGKYGDNKTADGFEFNDGTKESGTREAVWTEEETLLLLESVLQHGHDWELVAQAVKTKSKFDCISKLIQLPFGDSMLASAQEIVNLSGTNNMSNITQLHSPSSIPQSEETIKTENQNHDKLKDTEQNGDADNEGPPLKKKCTASSSLLQQVALMSTMVSPHVTAAAAEAAVGALCEENQCTREMFDDDRVDITVNGRTPNLSSEAERAFQADDSETKEMAISSAYGETQETFPEYDAIPQTLRYRAATATALGAAAARAKLLADREEREMGNLMAAIIETQMKKVQGKIKLFDDLEPIMKAECNLLEELEESIIAERISALQRAFELGISRWREPSSLKSQLSTVS